MGPLVDLLTRTRLSELLASGQHRSRARGASCQLVAFSSTCDVGHALKRLQAERLRSAPVVDSASHVPCSEQGDVLQGSFPLCAMVGFVQTGVVIEELLQTLPDYAWPPMPEDLEAAGAITCSRPVITVLSTTATRRGMSPSGSASEDTSKALDRQPWPTLGLDESVFDAVCAFSSNHMQHMLVRGHESCPSTGSPVIVDVVSQSDITRFIADNLPATGELARTTLAALGLAGRALAGRRSNNGAPSTLAGHSGLARNSSRATEQAQGYCLVAGGGPCGREQQDIHGHVPGTGRSVGWRLATIPEGASALDALRSMYAKSVSGVAIVGRRGELVGHISASDVRALRPGVFSQLLLPVREFIAMHVAQEPQAMASDIRTPASSCSATSSGNSVGRGNSALEALVGALPLAGRVLCAQPTSSFSFVVQSLVRQRVHRVYVTDSDCSPVGVVTCTDVLDTLHAAATRC